MPLLKLALTSHPQSLLVHLHIHCGVWLLLDLLWLSFERVSMYQVIPL